MVRIALFLFVVLLGFGAWLRITQPPLPDADPSSLRHTRFGAVVGFADTHNTHSWRGVPYAASTAQERRWRAPLSPEPWPATREALSFGPACPQPWSPFSGVKGKRGQIAGSEDCLSLNIWAPRFAAEAVPSGTDALPVMVWIHGGSNTVGSSAMYPASHLAGSEAVIVVSINYRLGVLGWFSHPAVRAMAENPEEASGNFGTLDTIAALRWVRDNIATFGGDPRRVTVFGESAGGRNVYMLLASPLASGLFQGAIVQSGSLASMPLEFAEHYTDDELPGLANSSRETIARLLINSGGAADRTGARSTSSGMAPAQLMDFLRERDLPELFAGLHQGDGSYLAPQVFRDGHVLPAAPLEEVFTDPETYNSVPLITGANRDEQKLFMGMNPEHAKLWFGIIPRIRDQAGYDHLAAYYSDRWRLAAVDVPAAIISGSGGQPVFAYRWDWDEGGSLGVVDWSTALGAAHGLEIPFVFGDFDAIVPIPRLFTEANLPAATRLSRSMMSYWATFARTGDPGAGTEGTLPRWQPWPDDGTAILLLDTEADGGIRMDHEQLTLADFRDRLAVDPRFADSRKRCSFYADLFYSPRRGRGLFDVNEYEHLGCGKYDVRSLSPTP